MSAIGGWLGTGTAIIVGGLCVLLMRYGHHLPSMTHPWQHRAVIAGMYCAGAVLAVTVAGGWVIGLARRISGLAGGLSPGSGLAWALITIAALFLAATVVIALVWAPDPGVAYIALLTPLALAMVPAGFAHQIYVATAGPAHALVAQIAAWAGG